LVCGLFVFVIVVVMVMVLFWFLVVNCCEWVCEGGEKVEIVELVEEMFCFVCVFGGDGGWMLFMFAALWFGVERMFDGLLSGEVCMFDVLVVGVGWF